MLNNILPGMYKTCESTYEGLDINSPLDQFTIRDLIRVEIPLGDVNLSLTNMGLAILMGAILVILVHLWSNKSEFNLLPDKLNKIMNAFSDTVISIVESQIGKKLGQIYIPFMYSLFMFILVGNLTGMIPYSFSMTSHFILAFSLSFSIVIGATIIGFARHGLKFFSLFVPSGCPLPLLPLLVIIETISYLARAVSLGLRLAANVLAGHMLLVILSGFTFNIMQSGLFYIVLGLFPLGFIVAFSALELAIAFIQAQVFVVLSCGYIRDGLSLH